MNVHSTFLYGLNRSTFSLPSKRASSTKDDFRNVSRSTETYNGRHLRSTLAERRSCPHPTPLLLPRKRSIRSLAPEYTQDVSASRSSSSPPYRSVKRTKEAALPLLSLKITDAHDDTANELSPPLEVPETSKGETTERAHSASIDGDGRESLSEKPLRSPIEFIVGLHGDDKVFTPTTPIQKPEYKSSSLSEKSRYQYYGPTNPSDQLERFPPDCNRVPRRQLSYGEPKPWSLHRVAGSQELRLKADSEAGKCDPVFGRANTAEEMDAARARKWYSEPMRPKPRLWLDPIDDGESIEEAQATVVISSPSKPKEVSIPPRRSSYTTSRSITPNFEERQASDFPLATPQESAIGLGISAGNDVTKEKEYKCYNRIKARNDWNATAQTSSASTPWSTRTVRRISQTAASVSRTGTQRPLPSTTRPQLSSMTIWILTGLENSIASNTDLRLDSPVLVQIRRKIPPTPPTIPLSRFPTVNVHGPLSSNPPPTPPNSITSSTFLHATPKSQSDSSPSTIPTTPTLRTLRTIFPHASTSLLLTLLAAYISLHYIQTIHLPTSPFPSVHPSPTHSSSSSSNNLSTLTHPYNHIPSKARAMLGLQTPHARPPLPRCWMQPQGRRSVGRGWRERVEDLETRLGWEVERKVGECAGGEGREGGGVDVLVRAVGEVVRLGEGVGVGV